MLAIWVVVLLACLGGTALASRHAVTSALKIADSIDIPPAVIGFTVMAIGTDLPEMANSIVASATRPVLFAARPTSRSSSGRSFR